MAAATILIKAVNHAHNKIVQTDQFAFETAVTLVGGVALRLPPLEDDDKKSPWAFIGVNVGDNRLFYWNHVLQKTYGNYY